MQREGESCPCCDPDVISGMKAHVDLDGNFITCAGQYVSLTPSEAEFSKVLIEQGGEFISRKDLLEAVKGRHNRYARKKKSTSLVDVTLHKIREKISNMPVTIITSWGRGVSIGPRQKE